MGFEVVLGVAGKDGRHLFSRVSFEGKIYGLSGRTRVPRWTEGFVELDVVEVQQRVGRDEDRTAAS